MSLLNKLGIAGVRSYRPDQMQIIQFKPLTLIWGENGSGKTTIIQCLKYVTTGITPPGTLAGKNFVLDPKRIQRPQVTAELKLNFSDYTGKKYIAGRKMMVSYIKKKDEQKMQFKTIQQTLKTKNYQTQQLVSINQHCAEIDRQIPALFGVSKSVLQNVIFCQQDEALWPFGDNTTLKGIFDELFETKQYSKIYEAMKENHKKVTKSIKQISSILEIRKQLFYKSIRLKKANLVEYEEILKQSQQIPILTEQLQKYQQMHAKYQLNLKQRSEICRVIGGLENRKKTLLGELQKLGLMEQQIINFKASIDKGQKINHQVQEIQQHLESFYIEVKQLEKLYAQAKQQQIQKDIGKRIELQINNIRSKFPFIKDTNTSIIVPRLTQEKNDLERASEKLSQFRGQLGRLHIPQLLQINQDEIQYKKLQLQLLNKNLHDLFGKLSFVYRKIYDPEVQFVQKIEYSQTVHEQLKYRLKISQQRLEKIKYEKGVLQKRLQNQKNKQRIKQFKYQSITIQQNMLNFANTKKKCVFCSRSLNDHQLQEIGQKCNKQIVKAKIKIQNLQKDNQNFQEASPSCFSMEDIQIEQRKLRRQILNLKQQIQSSEVLRQANQKYNKNSEQISLNKKIDFLLKKHGINPKIHFQTIPDIDQFSFESFNSYLNEYVNEKQQYNHQADTIKKLQDIRKENQNRLKQRENVQKRRNYILQNISQLQKKVSSLPLIKDSLEKLMQLNSKATKNMPKSKISIQTVQNNIFETKQKIQKNQQELDSLLKENSLNNLVVQFKQVSTDLQKFVQIAQNIDKTIELDKNQNQKCQELKIKVSNLKSVLQTRLNNIREQQENTQQYQKLVVQERIKRQAQKQIGDAMKALQITLTQFHSQKLEAINAVLKETWQKIYHGVDIQYIKIRSIQQEGQSSQNKKKPYSYALMMVYQNTQIQMKGRCSMGQKVLASIVIRLALAQCFAIKCNILALDQPTANLDSNHVQNLADSLNRLIQSRLEDSNFQLIIITHDRQFVGMFAKHIPTYYQVKKVEGWSKITAKENL